MIHAIVLAALVSTAEYRCVRWAWKDEGFTRTVWCLKWVKKER